MKGFLDSGRGGGSSKGEAGLLSRYISRLAGDGARLRKGLLDDRLRVRLEGFEPELAVWPGWKVGTLDMIAKGVVELGLLFLV